MENEDELYVDNQLSTKFETKNGNQITLFRHSEEALHIGDSYYYPLKCNGEYVKDENGGRLYESLSSSVLSELCSIKNNVVTNTGIAITGV